MIDGSRDLEANSRGQEELAGLLEIVLGSSRTKRASLDKRRRKAIRIQGGSGAAGRCRSCASVAGNDARVETVHVVRVENIQDRRLDPRGERLEDRDVIVECQVETALAREDL